MYLYKSLMGLVLSPRVCLQMAEAGRLQSQALQLKKRAEEAEEALAQLQTQMQVCVVPTLTRASGHHNLCPAMYTQHGQQLVYGLV